MVFNRTHTSRGTKEFQLKRVKNLEAIKKFPVGTQIAYRWKPAELVGTVIKHDMTIGRLITGRIGSHDPADIVIFKSQE